ncbi:MAG: hypothetical protein JNK15_08700 [Planctomycetes bacterium]|nr:hypothetical protein [Planctomycetota bacterium]
MKPILLVVALLAACACSKPAPATPTPAPNPTPAPVPQKATPTPFTKVQEWTGPEIAAARPAADGPLVVTVAAPTPGYTLTLDTVAVQGGMREVQVTLLQPAADAPVARVVTELELVVDAAKLAGSEPLAVAVRQMQVGCHYLVAPPWARAVVAAK